MKMENPYPKPIIIEEKFNKHYWCKLLFNFFEQYHPDFLFKIEDNDDRAIFINDKVCRADALAKSLNGQPLDIIHEMVCEQLLSGMDFSVYFFLYDYGQTFYPYSYKLHTDLSLWELNLLTICKHIRSILNENAFCIEEVVNLELERYFNIPKSFNI